MPRIGLLSDSHGCAAITHEAAKLLVNHGADVLLHLGDIGSHEVIDALLVARTEGCLLVPTRLVFGNTDWDVADLTRYAQHLDLHVDHPVGQIKLDKGSLLFMHGHDPKALRLALGQRPTYVCSGHTHQAADSRRAQTRMINPGALTRTPDPTVALLDTDMDQVRFLTVENC